MFGVNKILLDFEAAVSGQILLQGLLLTLVFGLYIVFNDFVNIILCGGFMDVVL